MVKFLLFFFIIVYFTGCENYTDLGIKGYTNSNINCFCEVTCNFNYDIIEQKEIVINKNDYYHVKQINIDLPTKLKNFAEKGINESISKGDLNIFIKIEDLDMEKNNIVFLIISASKLESSKYKTIGSPSKISCEIDTSYTFVTLDKTNVSINFKMGTIEFILPLSEVVVEGNFSNGGNKISNLSLNGYIEENRLDQNLKTLLKGLIGQPDQDLNLDGINDSWIFSGFLSAERENIIIDF